jgi:DNA-directed RNA polymerase I subunit RPA43
LTLAKTADEYGVLYVYLTATFLVFRPQPGQILEGWVNVQSEGFLGAVVLNLFSVGIERKRLPSNWKWVPPGEEEEENGVNSGGKPKKKVFSSTEDEDDSEPSSHFDPEKEHFKPISLASDANPFSETMDLNDGSAEDDEAAAEGYFQSVSGHRVRGTVRFRVVDIDVIPGSDRERGFLSIEGTMLSPEEEARVLEDERNGNYSSMTPRPQGQWEPSSAMSGALAGSTSAAPETQVSTADADAGALEESPSKKKERKTEKEKKSKSSKSKKKKEEK